MKERYRQINLEPTEAEIEEVIDFSRDLDSYRFVPPKGTFLLLFLRNFLAVLPYVVSDWKWIIARSSRPFLTSDNAVTLVGDTVDGGLGISNAQEIWLPIERHSALVLSKDPSLPSTIDNIPSRHTPA